MLLLNLRIKSSINVGRGLLLECVRSHAVDVGACWTDRLRNTGPKAPHPARHRFTNPRPWARFHFSIVLVWGLQDDAVCQGWRCREECCFSRACKITAASSYPCRMVFGSLSWFPWPSQRATDRPARSRLFIVSAARSRADHPRLQCHPVIRGGSESNLGTGPPTIKGPSQSFASALVPPREQQWKMQATDTRPNSFYAHGSLGGTFGPWTTDPSCWTTCCVPIRPQPSLAELPQGFACVDRDCPCMMKAYAISTSVRLEP